jgi:hypothetical protein
MRPIDIDLTMTCKVREARWIVPRPLVSQGGKCHGPIHRSGIKEGKPQPVGELSSDRAFSGPSRAIESDDHESLSFGVSSTGWGFTGASAESFYPANSLH